MTKKQRELQATREQEKLFLGHLRLAWRLAGRCANRYGLHYADCQDEAEGLLALCVAEYFSADTTRTHHDAGRSCATTWIYQRIYWPLKTWAERRQPRETPFANFTTNLEGEPTIISSHTAPERWADRLLRTLGEDAKTVVLTILHGPHEVVEDFLPLRGPVRGDRVREGLSYVLDWEGDRFARAWAELEAAI